MLPGVRFLLVAMVLSLSILVFGLGATALMRAAHEVFATNPSWRAAPETKIAQASEARPDLAMLQLDPPIPEPKLTDEMSAPTPSTEPAIDPSRVEDFSGSPETGSETATAALSDEGSHPEPAKPEIPVAETSQSNEAQSAVVGALPEEPSFPVPAKSLTTLSPSNAIESEVVPSASDQTSTPVPPEVGSAKTADLGAPSATIETKPPANPNRANPTPDRAAMKKRLEQRRAAERRRMALRARMAREAQQQAAVQPFVAQPFVAPPPPAINP